MSITYRGTQTYRGHPVRTQEAIMFVREDGSLGYLPAGTPLMIPVEDGLPTVERIDDDMDDLRAGLRIAQQAAERD